MLYSMVVMMAIVHLAFFTIFGVIIPKMPKQKIDLFNVDLVRNVKKKKLKKPKFVKDKGVKFQGKKINEKKPGAKRDNQKPPGPKKPKPPSNAKPPKKDNAAPNLPLKINLPKQKYPQLNPNADAKVYRQPKNPHDLGAPSGKDDGILGSRGTDGDVKGIGGGDGTGAGGGGGGGGGGGAGGFAPWIFWDYEGTKYGKNVLSADENKRMYLQSPNSRPLLVNAQGPVSDDELINMGNGTVEIRITIPASSQVPERGIPPNYRIINIKPDDSSKFDQMENAALKCMKLSGWYPAKRNGQPFAEEFTLVLRFYGRYKTGQ